MEIRKFQSSDNKDVVSLINTIMKTEFPADQKAYPIGDLKLIDQHYGGDGEQFFVAVEDDHIVGTVGVKREDERTALLRRIFVKQDYRNKGIGSKLIKKAISFCSDNNYELIIFKTTSRMQRAIDLCQRNGFGEKAKIDLGGIELYKFAYSITNRKASSLS